MNQIHHGFCALGFPKAEGNSKHRQTFMTESQQTDSVILGEVFDTSKVQFPHLASKNKNSAHFLE